MRGMGIAGLAVLVLLAGCQSPAYVAPAGDVATLSIENPNDGLQVWAWTYLVASDCRDRRVLASGEPIAPNSTSSPIRVAAGQAFSITLHASALRERRHREECSVTGSFVPERGASYRVGYVWGAERCSVRLLDLSTSQSVWLAQKRTVKPLSPVGAHCGPMGG